MKVRRTVVAPEEGGIQARWRGGVGKVDGVMGACGESSQREKHEQS